MKNVINKLFCSYERRKLYLEERGVFFSFSKNDGYALILVLLVTSLLIALTAGFIVETQTTIDYMKKFDGRLKAGCTARSGVELSKLLLTADSQGISGAVTGKSVDRNIDCYDDIWALKFPSLPMDDGILKIQISDENAKININAFANEFTERTRYYYIAQIFFLNMGLPMDFADIMHDWIDIDDSPFPYGAESGDYYMNLTPSYRTKNKAMDSIDECLMLKDMTPEIFYGLGGGNFGIEENLVDHNMGNISFDIDRLLATVDRDEEQTAEDRKTVDEIKIGKEKSRKLSDYFRTYGDSKDFLSDYNKININTASYRVISALTEDMTDDRVSELIRRRLIRPFTSIEDIKDIVSNDDEFETLKKYITVKSYIFRIKSTGMAGSTSVLITAYYNRDTKKILYWAEE